MSRPKTGLPNKKKLTLSISPDSLEMANYIRLRQNISLSEFLETAIQKEYKKLSKAGNVPDIQIAGQLKIEQ